MQEEGFYLLIQKLIFNRRNYNRLAGPKEPHIQFYPIKWWLWIGIPVFKINLYKWLLNLLTTFLSETPQIAVIDFLFQLKTRSVTAWRHATDHAGELSVFCWWDKLEGGSLSPCDLEKTPQTTGSLPDLPSSSEDMF